jgi:AraC family transcriptional regulator
MAASLDDLGLLSSQQRARWAGLPVQLLSTPPGAWRHSFTPPTASLSMVDTGSLTARLQVCGRTSDLDARSGTLALFRGGVEVNADQVGAWQARRIVVDLDLAAWHAKRLLDDDLVGAPLEYVPSFDDPALAGVLRAMAREVSEGCPNGTLFAESLSLGVLLHLGRTRALRPAPAPRERGRLAAWQLRRLNDLVDANLASDLSLDALAAAVGLSKPHFVRLFRRTVGTSPHNYVVDRRVERARTLLHSSTLSLVEVASEVGFASQSHLTRVFRRVCGVTPGEARRQYRLGDH